ncbi:MAG: hypothetical protein MJK08_01970 [Campylobacterales bacterium]|nr:hypothetical protein [Campylobacterales bacterium]NQY52821.1 hypothetical protein [Campylobacteraceae bacterium]
MNKILFVLILIVATLGANELIIKSDGSKVSLSFEKKHSFYILSNSKKFDDKVKVIVIYKDDKYKNYIETKYNLLNGKNKYGMYFIYEQDSQDIIELFSNLSKEKNIKDVHPNWTISSKVF